MNSTTPFPPQAKVLFIDEPFSEAEGIRAGRSRFLFEQISASFDSDLLLLKSSVYQEKPVAEHKGYDKLYSLSLDNAKTLYPESYHKLGTGQRERFAAILDGKRYEMVIMAGLACLPLSQIVHKVLPACPVVIDVEGNRFSELEAAWSRDKSATNYQAFWALAKQKLGDRLLLKSRNHYLFADPATQNELSKIFKLNPEKEAFLPLSWDVPANTEPSPEHEKFLLFWGDPSNPDNLSQARTLVSDIYPRISKRMVEKNISLVICGGEQLQELCGGRILYVPWAERDSYLQAALLLVLPLEKPDRELRLLSAAAMGKALLCTSPTLQGFGGLEERVFCEANPNALVEKLIALLRVPSQLEHSGKALNTWYQDNWTAKILQNKLINILYNWIGTKHE